MNLLRSLPGYTLNILLQDGTFITAGGNGLKRVSANGDTIWNFSGRYHHRIAEADENHFLAITDVVAPLRSQRIRFDVIEKRKIKDGSVVSRFSFLDKSDIIGNIASSNPALVAFSSMSDRDVTSSFADREYSHVNSVREIPAKFRKNFGNGNFLVNDPARGVCFALSENLDRVTWTLQSLKLVLRGNYTHDCSVTDNGIVLLFYNEAGSVDKKTIRASFLRFLPDGSFIGRFPKLGEYTPLVTQGGGVREFGDGFILVASDESTAEIIFTDKHGKVINKKRLPYVVQDLELGDFSKFLKLSHVF